MVKHGQFFADDSCLWSQEIDGAWESLKELDDGVCTFDNTTMRAVVFEQLKALRLTRAPAQRSNRPLKKFHLVDLTVPHKCIPGIGRQTLQVA